MCLTPINIRAKNDTERDTAFVPVPCGKCPKCRQRRVDGWVFRLLQEEKRHNSSLFVTLTYANPYVPITDNGFMSLTKDDPQKFFKRLRKNTGCNTIRYYLCGEYGDTTWRPHYHAILFDAKEQDIEDAWRDPDTGQPLGHVHFDGAPTGDSIAYVCKYINKEHRIPVHARDDRQPEFSLMSKRMGDNYLTPEMVRWHSDNEAHHVVLPGGHEKALPRYYREKIFNQEDLVRHNRLLQVKFSAKFEEDVKAAGSIEEYYRARHYAVRQAFKNQNKKRADL